MLLLGRMRLFSCLDKPFTPFLFPLHPLKLSGQTAHSWPQSCPLLSKLLLELTAHRFVQGPSCPSATSTPLPRPHRHKQRSLPWAQADGYGAARPNATDLFLAVPRAVPALADGIFLLLLLLQSLSLNVFDFLQLLRCLSHGRSGCGSLQSHTRTLRFLAKTGPFP